MFILYIYQYIINILYIHQCIIHILSQSVSGEDRDAHREAPRLLYMQMTAPFNTAGAATPCARRRRAGQRSARIRAEAPGRGGAATPIRAAAGSEAAESPDDPGRRRRKIRAAVAGRSGPPSPAGRGRLVTGREGTEPFATKSKTRQTLTRNGGAQDQLHTLILARFL